MTATGRYRFRIGLFGLTRVLQAEFLLDDDRTKWRDVSRRQLSPDRVFSIVRPSEWAAFKAADQLRARVELAERRAATAKRARQKKSGVVDFEASRLE